MVGPVAEIPLNVEVYAPAPPAVEENSKPDKAAIEMVVLKLEPVNSKLVGEDGVP